MVKLEIKSMIDPVWYDKTSEYLGESIWVELVGEGDPFDNAEKVDHEIDNNKWPDLNVLFREAKMKNPAPIKELIGRACQEVNQGLMIALAGKEESYTYEYRPDEDLEWLIKEFELILASYPDEMKEIIIDDEIERTNKIIITLNPRIQTNRTHNNKGFIIHLEKLKKNWKLNRKSDELTRAQKSLILWVLFKNNHILLPDVSGKKNSILFHALIGGSKDNVYTDLLEIYSDKPKYLSVENLRAILPIFIYLDDQNLLNFVQIKLSFLEKKV